MVAYEMHLQQPMRSVWNLLDAPDGQGKPLPERPETQKTTCTSISRAKCQSPSKTYRAVRSLRLRNGAAVLLLLYLQDKDGSQYQYKSCEIGRASCRERV